MDKEFSNTLLPILVFKTLIKETNVNKPMTISQIKEYIIEEYGIEMSERTIERHINSFRNFEFGDFKFENIKRRGFYAKNLEPYFDDSEIIYLNSVLQNSKNMPKKYRQEMIDKLSNLSEINLNKNNSLFLMDTENERINYSSLIDLAKRACEESKYIKVKKDFSNRRVNEYLLRDEDVKIKPYLLAPYNQNVILIGARDSDNSFIAIILSQVLNIKVLEESFKKEKIILNFNKILRFDPNLPLYEFLVKEYPQMFIIKERTAKPPRVSINER